jgi:hypothetical protein
MRMKEEEEEKETKEEKWMKGTRWMEGRWRWGRVVGGVGGGQR